MKRNLPFLIGVALILLALPVGWYVFVGGEQKVVAPPVVTPPPVAAIDAGPKKSELKLTEVTGSVQIRRADGSWGVAKVGDTLNPSDGVKTEDGSYAVVVGGDYWEVKMEPGTEVSVGELSESISRLLLETGMARAKVKGSQRHTFEVKAAKSDAVARTDGGVFSISSNGEGTVAVGTQEGEVEFLGKGRVVIVRAGQQSIVRPGQAPTEPVAVPGSLLLKVALPGRTTVNTPKLKLVGTADPGSRVEVAGRIVRVDAKGKFETQVPLKEGKNALEIRAMGVSGGEQKSTHQIELDTTVRKATIDKGIWK